MLNKISNNKFMPLCLFQAKILKFTPTKMYYVNMPHLQTNKHRFRTYSKPISKIISL